MQISLKCLNCGAALTIPEGVDQMACGYCGVQQTVQREGGGVWLTLEKALADVKATADRTAAELALRRLSEERAATYHRLDELREVAQEASNRSVFATYQVSVSLLVFGIMFFIFARVWFGSAVSRDDFFFYLAVFVVIWLGVCGVIAGVNLSQRRSIRDAADSEATELEGKILDLDQQIEKYHRIVTE